MVGVTVIGPSGRYQRRATPVEAARMIRRGQAVEDGNTLRLIETGIPHPCRTHTARGLFGEQCYTTANHLGQVDGFKRIYPEDAAIFHSATRDAGATLVRRMTIYTK